MAAPCWPDSTTTVTVPWPTPSKSAATLLSVVNVSFRKVNAVEPPIASNTSPTAMSTRVHLRRVARRCMRCKRRKSSVVVVVASASKRSVIILLTRNVECDFTEIPEPVAIQGALKQDRRRGRVDAGALVLSGPTGARHRTSRRRRGEALVNKTHGDGHEFHQFLREH